MKNASVSWTTSSTNDRGILQSRFRHEHSGLRSLLEGASIPCMLAVESGLATLIISGPILTEFSEKLTDKFGVSTAEVDSIVERWATRAELASIEGKAGWVPADPEDDKFIETALIGGAAIIVSGDRHPLAVGKVQGVATSSCPQPPGTVLALRDSGRSAVSR